MVDANKNETEAIQQGGYSASMETAREFVRRMAEDGIQGNLYGLLTSLCIRDAAIWQECIPQWIDVQESLPESGKFVLAFFTRHSPAYTTYPIVIRAFHAAPKSVEQFDDDDEDFSEYDEISDKFYLPEGWYECNEEEDCHFFVHEKITHWMPLPESPISIWKRRNNYGV